MSRIRGLLLIFFIILEFLSPVWMFFPLSSPQQMTFPDDVIKVASLRRVKDILNHYGYPGEEYTVQTADGYRLRVSRIPNPGGKTVLLMHGLRGSSVNWIMMGPWSDLAYQLHDNGYDVWLGNTRGTRFGQRHIELSPSQAQFWNFSLHEIGLYDVPATIDFVLEKSGKEKLSYVGHSQGAAVLYILTSLRPEYNEKIIVMHGLAPAVYMHNLRSQFKTIAKYYLEAFQYPYYGKVDDVNYSALCHSNDFLRTLCLDMFQRFYGPSEPGALNLTMSPVLLAHYPETCSIRQIAHYYQIHRKAIFAPFDYDFEKARRINASPYAIERITIPNAIYYCGDDYIVDPKDVKQLIKELPNVIYKRFVERCSHLDVIISTRAREEFYNEILGIDARVRSGK